MNSSTKQVAFCLFLLLLLLVAPPYTAAQPSPSGNDGYGSYARVTPSMAIIIVVLIAALFFMGFFSIYIRHCTEAGGGSVRATNVGRSRRGAAARGLEAAVIEAFPTLVYSEVKGLRIGKGALECAVCLSEFQDDETLRLIPKCDHVFHPECIDVWLASHTTCPVCRANLTPQPNDSNPQSNESQFEFESESEWDLEDHNVVIEVEPDHRGELDNRENINNVEMGPVGSVGPKEPEVVSVGKVLNRTRTRGSRSGRPRRFPRSHSTGHSLVQPGENVDRFTLRLPVEVRKQIMNRKLNRTMSMVAFSGERSVRRGFRMGGEGSSRGKRLSFKRLDSLDQNAKSDRWVFNVTQPIFARASSFLARASPRSPKVPPTNGNDGEGTSNRLVGPERVEPTRPPI